MLSDIMTYTSWYSINEDIHGLIWPGGEGLASLKHEVSIAAEWVVPEVLKQCCAGGTQ